jgi:hypothetical protein
MSGRVPVVEDEILNRAAFDAVFGGWSSFHDSMLVGVRLRTDGPHAPTVEADFDLPRAFEPQRDGSMRPVEIRRVTLEFRRVALVTLKEFLPTNWVGELYLARVDPTFHEGRPLRVTLEGIAGTGCDLDLVCDAIAVGAIADPDSPAAA